MRRVVVLALLLALPAMADDGYKQLFDGKSLDGWRGDTTRWSVVDGAIVGRTKRDAPLIDNTFLIWDKGRLHNFDLRLEYRMKMDGDSGILYRCREVKKWRVGGYQCDVRLDRDTGLLYDELGRGYLARPGKCIVLEPRGYLRKLGPTADSVSIVSKSYIKPRKWNEVRVLVRGNHHVHIVNGREVIQFVDLDPDKQVSRGMLALQLHKGEPMSVEYRNIRLKKLEDQYHKTQVQFRGEDLRGWKTAGKAFTMKEGMLTATGEAGTLMTDEVYPTMVLRFHLERPETPEGAPAKLLLRGTDLGKETEAAIEITLGGGKTGEVRVVGALEVQGDAAAKKIHPRREKTRPMPLDHWRPVEIELLKDTIRIYVAHELVNEIKGFKRAHGPIAFRGGGEKIRIRQLMLIPVN